MLNIFLMIANYFHDLAVAVMVSNILVVYYLGKKLAESDHKEQHMRYVFRKLSKVTWTAFAFVIIWGAVRGYFFMEFEWNPAVGKGQVVALIVKHVILVALTVFGLIVHRRYSRIYG